jgi:sRNA-binding protein
VNDTVIRYMTIRVDLERRRAEKFKTKRTARAAKRGEARSARESKRAEERAAAEE